MCWLLGHIFATPGLGSDCVFKGGTSLSKVFRAIARFSEDIDLGLSPASLGWKESDLDDAPSNAAEWLGTFRAFADRHGSSGGEEGARRVFGWRNASREPNPVS